MSLKILSATWHRNGIGGVGFYAILFRDAKDNDNRVMVASLFDEPGYCAVYDVEKLHEENVKFGDNSWRGDVYESQLRILLEKFLKKSGSNRLGSFSVV